jgi:transposase
MLQHPVRKIMTDRIWQLLEPAVRSAKHSPAGSQGDLTDREFLEALLPLLRTGSP